MEKNEERHEQKFVLRKPTKRQEVTKTTNTVQARPKRKAGTGVILAGLPVYHEVLDWGASISQWRT